ncbi:hypothetical protein PS2_008869 [Malus domestica]
MRSCNEDHGEREVPSMLYLDLVLKAVIGMLNRYVLNYIFSIFVNSSFVKFLRSHLVRWQVPSPMSGRSRVRDLGAASP